MRWEQEENRNWLLRGKNYPLGWADPWRLARRAMLVLGWLEGWGSESIHKYYYARSGGVGGRLADGPRTGQRDGTGMGLRWGGMAGGARARSIPDRQHPL